MAKKHSLIFEMMLAFVFVCLLTVSITIVGETYLNLKAKASNPVPRNVRIRNVGHSYSDRNEILIKPNASQQVKPTVSSNVSVTVPARTDGIGLTDSFIHSQDGKQFRIIKKLARHRNHTNVGNETYFIFSAIANINSSSPSAFLIVFSGWELGIAWKIPYTCCMLHRNGTISSVVTRSKRFNGMGKNVKYQARQIVCPYQGSGNPLENPIGVGLVLTKDSCSSDVIYEEPTYNTYDASPRFAVTGKVAYGSKNPNQLIEWVEFNRYFGASKLLIYPYYDLNDDARKVVDYYSKEGILDVVPMAPVPLLKKIPRQFGIPHTVMYQDEETADNDGQERLAPYVYFALIDTDEFLLPNRSFKSYVEMMGSNGEDDWRSLRQEGLLKKHPTAGSFVMKVQIHPFDWGRTNDHQLMLSRYSNHTETMKNTPKLLHVSDRIEPGTAWINSVQNKKGFKRLYLDDDFIVMKHFRKCRKQWLETELESTKTKCFDIFKRSRDLYLEEIAEEIQRKVLNTRKVLGIDY